MHENGVSIDVENGVGAVASAVRSNLETPQAQAGLSLLFAVGERPSAAAIECLLASESVSGQHARISHRPDDDEGWLELLASGLTFDLTGLAPAGSAVPPPMEHQFGIALNPAQFQFEAITMVPGGHIAGGRAMMPVVRTMIGLAAGIALPLSVKAVCWHPAQSWMEPGYFTRIVVNWLSGGAFPALGLTALAAHKHGGYESVGLAFFAGQELRIDTAPGETRAVASQRASRVIDHIVRNGRLTELYQLETPAGETVLAEPTRDGRYVRVWRSA